MEDLHDLREMNKMGLDLYLEDYEFPNLEELLKNAIDELQSELKKKEVEYQVSIMNDSNTEHSFTPYIVDEIFSIQNRLLSIYEMIIVNDYPHQKLYFEHPKVKIYNLDTTFQTIGEKERCMEAISRLLTLGNPIDTKGPKEGELAADAEGSSAGGSSGGFSGGGAEGAPEEETETETEEAEETES